MNKLGFGKKIKAVFNIVTKKSLQNKYGSRNRNTNNRTIFIVPDDVIRNNKPLSMRTLNVNSLK